MSKIEPAQRTLRYTLPYGVSYVDLAEALSKVNRRFYRQGMQYGVAGIEFMFAADSSAVLSVAVSVNTAGSTWVVHNAWKKAQAHWLKQQRDSRRVAGAQSIKPAYEDFKVYLDDSHRTGTILPVLAGDSAAVLDGEWNYSKFVYSSDADAAVLEPHMHLVGGDVAATDVGLVEAYEESRSTVQSPDPNAPATASHSIYALMATNVNEVADEVVQNMETENDQTPYDIDEYPGGETNSDAAWFQQIGVASVGAPKGHIGPFAAQCGLVKFEFAAVAPNGSAVGSGTVGILIHLAPGPYKGILAESMGQ